MYLYFSLSLQCFTFFVVNPDDMGCNASQNVSVHQDTFSYIEYEGRGNDYLNYSYYQTYFKNSNDQTLWNDYYRIRNVYETSQQNSETNEASGADDFDQYKHWRDHKKQQGKITSQKEEQYKSKVDMVVENSAAEIIAADEPDCITDGATQLRMGLKTVGTALRITIIKKKEECSQGPAQLKVKVLDTLHFDKPDIDFITRRPTLQPDHKYIDKEFECSKALGKYLDQFQWKRPQEILPDKEICLFHEGTSMADVDQGKFGSCYFLAVLAGLATQPEVMRQIILPDAYDIKNGVFHCRFWKFGQWIDVYVDDYLPCDSNGLVGCQSKDYSGEMWTPLLEKAYAKFMGSYPNMESGIPRDAYVALTGGCAEWLPLTYYKFDLSAVYNRIANALKHASVVVCSSTPTEEKKEQVKERNIVLNHAYTVTATAIVS
ncbi:hypothetical protein EB796_006000 [Bugula neritina]|uniref:Calpain catalytic domain-containing protein n=1 Tax=Bugula neritina TaxID=10212 RepID=A0A7J7KBN7_BUGNE|nr:hypothetical protein EB796_006000 [Bugula neritina]